MSQKSVITILIIAVVVLVGATTYFAITKNTSRPSLTSEVTQQPVPTPTVQQPSQPATNQQPAVQNVDQNTITEQDMENLKIVLNEKYPSYVSPAEPDYMIKVFKKNGRYIKAVISNKNVVSEDRELFSYPSFYAYKADDGWKIVFSGQEIPECSVADKYNFPNDIITECFDGQKGVQR